jgi:sarcosine oxidase subunit gamma
MSDAISALTGASFEGLAAVHEAGLRGMITVRGELGAATLKRAVKKVTGFEVPPKGGIFVENDQGVAWVSPDELLVLVPYELAQAHAATLSDALQIMHHLAVNISDSRALFTLAGAGAREVLAKLCPADLAPQKFTGGQFRRTRLAQVAAAIWISGEDQISIICFRSVAQYVFELLRQAAHPASRVGYF